MKHPDGKTCPACNALKPRGEYNLCASKKDGLQSRCRACQKARYYLNHESNLARAKAWKEENPEQARQGVKNWVAANRERKRAADRRWRKKNADRHKATNQKWNADNKERITARARRNKLALDYGITPEAFDAMRERQCGACDICKEPFTKTPRVDHDHSTGFVRSLLCHGCNAGLGFFRDSPELMEAGADYIRKHSKPTLKLISK